MAELKPFNLTRARAQHARPFLGFALYALHPVEVEGIENMTGDMYWRIYYDPVWLKKLTDENIGEAAWRLIHLTTHMLRKHGYRAKNNFILGEDGRELWGIATDLEINDDILAVNDYIQDGLKAPDKTFMPTTFGFDDGELSEKYYSDLREMADDDGDGGGNDDQSGGGSDQDGQSGQEKLQEAMDNGPDDQGGEDGSCATGQPNEYELGTPTEKNPGNNEARNDLIQMQTAQEIKNQSKQRGNMPAGWQRWADGIIDPRIPWDKVLKARIRQALAYASGMVDYTYSKPSRRGHPKIVTPALRRPKLKAGLIVDTSGSMSDRDMALALGAIKGVLKACGEDGIQVISADADVHNVQQVYSASKVSLLGGGGTDMCIPMEHFGDMPKHKRPNVVVVVSDAYTPWPEKSPGNISWVFLLTNDGEPPSFGSIIYRNSGRDNSQRY